MPKAQNIEVELELTYLARELPAELVGVKSTRITDTYIPEDSSYPPIRLRQKGDKYEITKKEPVNADDFSYQTEQTIPLREVEFNAIAKCSQRQVEKDRYKVNIESYEAEVDVFTGDLKGLVLIDFEFKDFQSKLDFTPPKCCLADVTQELFIAGGQLAGKKYEDIESDLARYKYKKIDK